MISAVHLKKYYPVASGIRSLFLRSQGKYVKAIDDISFDIAAGEVMGLVGESGCGKTTTGRVFVGLEEQTAGDILINKQSIRQLKDKDQKKFYRYVQMIFQDPYGSINPQHNVFQILSRPLRYQGVSDRNVIRQKSIETLELVGLSPVEDYLDRYPHHLSGGQLQRLCIGRAIILDPEFLVADEPLSMLDVSIKSDVLRLLKTIVQKKNVSGLYITHDLAILAHISQRIAVMYLGRIVEIGDTDEVLDNPLHPYTHALISAIPIPDPNAIRETTNIAGAIPDPINLPPGCRFSPRCPRADTACTLSEPDLDEFIINTNHHVACFHPLIECRCWNIEFF